MLFVSVANLKQVRPFAIQLNRDGAVARAGGIAINGLPERLIDVDIKGAAIRPFGDGEGDGAGPGTDIATRFRLGGAGMVRLCRL